MCARAGLQLEGAPHELLRLVEPDALLGEGVPDEVQRLGVVRVHREERAHLRDRGSTCPARSYAAPSAKRSSSSRGRDDERRAQHRDRLVAATAARARLSASAT